MTASIGLNFADWLIIALYFGFVLGLGWYLKRLQKRGRFFLAAAGTVRG